MFQPDTNGNAFRLYLNLCFSQIPVNISGTVTCGEYDGAVVLVLGVGCWVMTDGFNTYHRPFITQYQSSHLSLEMHLSATSDNRVAHSLNDLRQAVCTDMWMGIGQY